MPNRIRTLKPDNEAAINREVQEFPPAQTADEDAYFRQHQPPEYLDEMGEQIKQFLAVHQHTDRKVALVTSGGTTVPLENNTVRFIDNFSAGTRGATLTEYFLEMGYAVIFLHREFLLLPYSRHYSHTTNCFLDYMEERDNKVEINLLYAEEMLGVLRKYHRAQAQQLLLLLPFTTVNQYLYTLQLASKLLQPVGPRALFYLAAAVSDFFLPLARIPEHKIQLQLSGTLVVNLEPVPKFLRRLVDLWAPSAMIVLFKLETDSSILISKARGALERYQHQLVIGNLLQTRKNEVVFVTMDLEEWVRLLPLQQEQRVEIELLLVPKVAHVHEQWQQQHTA